METAPRPANFTFFGSRRVLRVALPDTVYLTAEGNCCWEVYRGRRFRVGYHIVYRCSKGVLKVVQGGRRFRVGSMF